MEALAGRLRTALNRRDADGFRSLLAPDATWGDDPSSDRYCRSRDEVISDYQRLLDDGVAGTVVETFAGPGGVACLLEVEWPDPESQGRGARIYQAFRVEDGKIVGITGHPTEADARAAIAS